MNDFYTPPQVQELSEAARAAKQLLCNLGPARDRAIIEHVSGFNALWRNPNATPDEILFEMGCNAAKFLAAARTSLNNLIAVLALTGDTLESIPRECWYPPREFIPHDDGTVTLAPPADGFDAWGIPIPEPQPEQPTEPQPEPK